MYHDHQDSDETQWQKKIDLWAKAKTTRNQKKKRCIAPKLVQQLIQAIVRVFATDANRFYG